MSLAIKQIYTRPNLDIPFFAPSPEFIQYKYNNYVKKAHILFQQTTFSEDKLTQVNFIVFANRESRILFLSDEQVNAEIDNRMKYNQINNITTERIFILD